MKYSELEKLLKQNGCIVLREGANHCIWYSKMTNTKFTVPRHKSKEVPKGTFDAIMKSAGLK